MATESANASPAASTQPSQSVVSLPLAPAVRHALLCAGISSVADLRGLSEAQLMAEAALPQELAAEVLLLALGQPTPGWRLKGAVTAAELLLMQARGQPGGSSTAAGVAGAGGSSNGGSAASTPTRPRGISTGCTALDAVLGGSGVACGTVTEFYGVPGVGKTQIGMQLAVNVQLPAALGGLGGRAMYIDTEGSFMTDRLIDLAQAAVQRVQTAAAAAPPPPAAAAPAAAAASSGAGQAATTDASRAEVTAAQAAQSLTLEAVLSNIMYIRVQHHTEQLALVNVLDWLLQQHPQVALVVLDSATFHFRHDFADAAQRSRVLLHMAQQLAEVAEQRGVACVMVNQVVTRITDAGTSSTGTGSSSSSSPANSVGLLAPALGEGWGQAASCRVALFWQGSQRYAMVAKAKHVPAASTAAHRGWLGSMCVPYRVGPSGVS